MKIQSTMRSYSYKPKFQSEYKKVTAFFRDDSNTERECFSVDDVKDLFRDYGAIKPYCSFSNESSILCLDFDNKASAKEVLLKAKSKSLLPTFAYKTLSETYTGSSKSKINRFRFVYVLDDTINSEGEYESFTKMLRDDFIESDKSTFNAKRWFFTGKRHDKNLIFFEGSICSKKELGVRITTSNILNKSNTTYEKSTKRIDLIKSDIEPVVVEDIGYLLSGCQSFKDLSTKKINHEVKLMLLSNFIHIVNGELIFNSILKNGTNTNDKLKWKHIGDFLKEKNYSNLNCSFSCPHCSDCKIYKKFGSIYNFYKSKDYSDIELPTISIEEGRAKLSKFLRDDVLSYDKNKVFVYKVQAGLGKTHEVITQYCKYGVVAFPNHNLLNDKIKEYSDLNIYQTPDITEIVTLDSDVDLIKRFYSTGNIYAVKEIVRNYPGGLEFLKKKNIPLTNKMFTTHEKTMNSRYDPNCHLIFYDEDPINSTYFKYHRYTKKLVIKDISVLKEIDLINDNEKSLLINFVNHISRYHNVPKKFNSTKINISEIKAIGNRIRDFQKGCNIKIKNNLAAFFAADIFSLNSFSSLRLFPEDKSIFIMSATPDLEMISKVAALSGKELVVREITDVRRKGKLKQVIVNSSKRSFDKNEERVKELIPNGSVTITYKEKSKSYNDKEEFVPYCGNTFGYNSLKGINTNVYHTFQCPPDVFYHKYALIYETNVTDTSMSYRFVDFDGKGFRFYAFNDLRLCKVALNQINAEIVQSLERSRTLTEDCESTIFSNFICSIMRIENCEFI